MSASRSAKVQDQQTTAGSDAPEPTHRSLQFHKLTIADVRRETADTVSIAFLLPADLAKSYTFNPGQHITIRYCADGEELRRCYSICSQPGTGELRVAVKHVPAGVFSGFANDALKPGMQLDVMTPSGTFCPVLEPGTAREKNYLAIAAGSGITPVISILGSVLEAEPSSNVTLLYVNRTTNSIIFRGALSDLKDRCPSRFSLVHILTREATDVPLYSGRLDAEKLKSFVPFVFDPSKTDQVFLCGPAVMVEGLRGALTELGIGPQNIKQELFTPAVSGTTPRPRPPAPSAAAAAGAKVTAVLDGVERVFTVGPEDTSIIHAARAAGIELPYSCSNGMCATCRAKLVEGEVEMAANYSLEPWELEAGYVLTCQSRPKTSSVKVDYDQV
jgi:ring-1,2-phenylacetyl-CoA epoxidase subunit PaaE